MEPGADDAQLEEWRRQARELWERMAERWERGRDSMWEPSRSVSEWLVGSVAPRPGETILDVAAGVGDTGFLAAPLVEPGGRVITSDAVPEMVDAARRTAERLGIGNAEFRVLDGERMELEDSSVDGIVCRWGYMLMADTLQALREARRVLRPGGRLAFSVWGDPDRNPWATTAARVMVRRGHLPERDPDEPGMFRLRDPAATEALVRAAGFDRVEVEEVPLTYRYESADAMWAFVSEYQGSIALVLERVDEGERDAVRAEVEAAAEGFREGDGYALPGVTLNFAAQ